MKMSGEEIIPADIETVWRALNDPDVLQQCIPGCESITKKSATEMSARVVAKVGPVKAGFNGTVQLKDLKPPHSYRIEGKGEGGLAGAASGGATISLVAVAEGTKITYDVDAQVIGKMAMLGSRLIDSAARSLASQFFDKFVEVAAKLKSTAEPAKKPATKKAVGKKKAASKKPAPAKKAVAKKAAKKKANTKK
jgi:uncharacterized protein